MSSAEDLVACSECGTEFDDETVMRDDGKTYCPGCGERVCRRCGCTQYNACDEGCAWDPADPEVCDAH